MAIQQASIDKRGVGVAPVEKFDTVVIGGGQAGLSVGYYLKKRGGTFVILDSNERIGGSWRNRTWNSLRLFTPARYDALPGWPFPAPGWSYPTARETADYLEAYAARLELPVRSGMTVDRLAKDGDRFVVECGERRLKSDNVVVATGFYGAPSVPDLQPSSIRASCRCIQASTAIHPSYGREPSSWSAPGTQAPISAWRSPRLTPPGSPGGTRDRYRSGSRADRRDSCCRFSGSSPRMCSQSRLRSVARSGRTCWRMAHR